MFKKIVSAPVKAVEHVGRHKGTYFMGSVAFMLLLANASASRQFTEFLVEKGIDPLEYFNPEFYAELHP